MLLCFRCLSVFVWTGENDSNTLRVDAYFFEKGGRSLIRIRVDKAAFEWEPIGPIGFRFEL